MLKEPTRRIRFLTHEEAERLLSVLPEHLADMAVLALTTGLRQANVTGLLWSQLDLVRRLAWIHPDQAKARRAIPVPLYDNAVACISKQLGKHPTHVFSYRGKPITQVSTKAWYSALERAEIEEFRWHDLRHTWASWHIQGGHRCLPRRSWEAGKVQKWCVDMRILLQITLHPLRIGSVICRNWKNQPMAQFCHSLRKQKSQPPLSDWLYC